MAEKTVWRKDTDNLCTTFGSIRVGGEVEHDVQKLRERAARFQDTKQRPQLNSTLPKQHLKYHAPSHRNETKILGTNLELEKSYLRLTKAPANHEIRPLNILILALDNVKTKWEENHNYGYACEQLKSIRQDLVVQKIDNNFTREVYETHARLALSVGDHEEFNQCLSRLEILFTETGGENKVEFLGYRILYSIFTNATIDIIYTLKKIGVNEKKSLTPVISIHSALNLNNFYKFFKLYKTMSTCNIYLINWFLQRQRILFLKQIITVYRPFVDTSWISEIMAFNSIESCIQFLLENKVIFTDNFKTKIDCKATFYQC